MNQSATELLSRLEAGAEVFFPDDASEEALEEFQVTARHILALRARGLVHLPEGRITRNRVGRVFLLGPCELTDAGRQVLAGEVRRARVTGNAGRLAAHRQARLRPESADLYPDVPRNVWLPAAWLTDHLLLRWRQQGAASLQSSERVLNPKHFEFRCRENIEALERANHRVTDRP